MSRLLPGATNPPIFSDGTEFARLTPVDYYWAFEPVFRMYPRICCMMLSMVRQVRRYGPPQEVFALSAIIVNGIVSSALMFCPFAVRSDSRIRSNSRFLSKFACL